MLAAADVEAIERATVAAVAPDAVHEVGGWLVALNAGTLARATSATPLGHELAPAGAVLDEIEGLYERAGLAPQFRIADVAGLSDIAAELTRRGYAPHTPTLVKTGAAGGLRALSDSPAGLADRPDDAWAAAFGGEGFDPADAASRLRNLSRSPGAAYASVREGGRALAVGAAAVAHGWVSVHGMRTDRSRRGEGLAGRVLSALGQVAETRGSGRVFLQVEEPNAPARALYRRAGLAPAWRYFYWGR